MSDCDATKLCSKCVLLAAELENHCEKLRKMLERVALDRQLALHSSNCQDRRPIKRRSSAIGGHMPHGPDNQGNPDYMEKQTGDQDPIGDGTVVSIDHSSKRYGSNEGHNS